MGYSSSDDSQRGIAVRRVVVLALAGLLLVSAVGGVIGSGIAAAQQGGSGGYEQAGAPKDPKKPKDGTITKQDFRHWITKVQKMPKGKAIEAVQQRDKMREILVRVFSREFPDWPPGQVEQAINTRPRQAIEELKKSAGTPVPVPQLPSKKPDKPDNPGDNPGDKPGPKDPPISKPGPEGPTNNKEVNKVIEQWKANNLRYNDLSKKQKTLVISYLKKLSKDNLSDKRVSELEENIINLFSEAFGGQVPLSEKRLDIVGKVMGHPF